MALKITHQPKFSHFFCPYCCRKDEPSLFTHLEFNSKELLYQKQSLLHKQLISLINHAYCSLNRAVRSTIRKESSSNRTVGSSIRTESSSNCSVRSSILTESSLNRTVWSSIRAVCPSTQAEALLNRMDWSLN